MRGINGDLDCNLPSTDVFTLKGCDGLLLFSLRADVDEAITLAFPGLSPSPANNASRDDADTGFREESRKTSIINVETEVGNKEHGLGRFADGVFASRASGTGSLGLASARSLLLGCVTLSDRGSSGFLAFSFSLGLTLTKMRRISKRRKVKVRATNSSLLLLFLGFGSLVRPGGSLSFGGVSISLGFRDLPGNSLAAAPAGSPLGLLLLLLLVLLVGRFGNLDNYRTTIEVLLVKGFDGLLSGLSA
jgi:hypothetical protein